MCIATSACLSPARQALGLSTCLIGFAVNAIQKDGRIKDLLKIPREENVHAVIAVGYPAVTYQRLTGRKKAVSRFVEPDARNAPRMAWVELKRG